jgi:hypothetical protein
MTDAQIETAGKAMKILRLCNNPMMDSVSIKLNCILTHDEKRIAKIWAQAFELAQTETSAWNVAKKIK